MDVPRVAVSVDLVVLTVRVSQLCALVWRRDAEPHQGQWGLPGGFIRLDEDLPATAARVLAERAGLPDAPVHLEQLGTYGYPDRDPRQRVVSVAYLGLAPDLPAPDQPRMSWQPIAGLTEMAFDHVTILRHGIDRARAKLEYTSLGAAFCRDEFTVAELRRVYEIVWGTPLDPRNFHRKVTGADRFLVETGAASSSGGRPAQLYRRGPAELLHPPMLRPRPRPPGSVAGPASSPAAVVAPAQRGPEQSGLEQSGLEQGGLEQGGLEQGDQEQGGPERGGPEWPGEAADRYISVAAEAECDPADWHPDYEHRIASGKEDDDVRTDTAIPADS